MKFREFVLIVVVRRCNDVHNSLFLSPYNLKYKNKSISVETLIVAEFERISVEYTLRTSWLSVIQFTIEVGFIEVYTCSLNRASYIVSMEDNPEGTR